MGLLVSKQSAKKIDDLHMNPDAAETLLNELNSSFDKISQQVDTMRIRGYKSNQQPYRKVYRKAARKMRSVLSRLDREVYSLGSDKVSKWMSKNRNALDTILDLDTSATEKTRAVDCLRKTKRQLEGMSSRFWSHPAGPP
jgi:predicted house-cleaning NTP pyrophosphatase (Maf/HAM1 superfamily)